MTYFIDPLRILPPPPQKKDHIKRAFCKVHGILEGVRLTIVVTVTLNLPILQKCLWSNVHECQTTQRRQNAAVSRENFQEFTECVVAVAPSQSFVHIVQDDFEAGAILILNLRAL